MTLWIVALVLWTFTASLGTQQGAIRMVISLVGVLVAAAASFKFDHLLRPLMPLAGVYHPVWYWFLPPILVFLAVLVVFWTIGQTVHHQVEMRFKHRARGAMDVAWDRLNSRLGTCVGLVAGTVYLVVFCLMATVGGYFTAQLNSGVEPPWALRFLGALRADVQGSGFHRLLGAFDPTPAAVYDAADTLGVIQHNPDLLPRVAEYPYFLGLAERQEFQDIATDVELQKILQQPAQVSNIFTNDKVQAVVKSEDIRKHLLQLDPKDLLGFLKTGASARYPDPVLGRWELDAVQTVAQFRRDNPGASPAAVLRLQDALVRLFAGTMLIATTEEQVFVKSRVPELPNFTQIINPRPVAAPRPAPAPNTRNRPRAPQPPPPPAAAPVEASVPSSATLQAAAQGSWKKDGENFSLTLQSGAGDQSGTASVTADGRLRVTLGKQTLIFHRP